GVWSHPAISGSFGWKGGISIVSSIADGTLVGSVYLQLMSTYGFSSFLLGESKIINKPIENQN
ncbi:MAG: hypothetical protein LM523_06645, partial [Candidatus Contendobacter sp.]|nr:hypothetical protein [Candidatus Contendobacter sp.]